MKLPPHWSGFEVRPEPESLGKGLLACVDPHVNQQAPALNEALATQLAGKPSPQVMVSDASPQTAAPDGAPLLSEGVLPPVDVSPAVGQRVPTLCETFATHPAEMPHPPFVDSVMFLL